jgi:peptidoglycan/LPS O-acetylase OafA/YrhL
MVPLRGHPVLGVGWTLEHETLFYAAIAGLLLLKAPAFVGLFMTLLSVATIAFHLVCGGHAWDYHLFSGYNLQFAVGVGLQWLLSRTHGSSWLLCFGLFAFPFTASLMPTLYPSGIAPTQPIGAVGLVRVVLFGLGSAGVISGLVALERDGRLSGHASRVICCVGDLSFAIYLIHPLVYQVLGRVIASTGLGGAPLSVGLVLLALAFAAVFPLSLAFHYAVERPFLRRPVTAGSAALTG